jgi:hypothetical protein
MNAANPSTNSRPTQHSLIRKLKRKIAMSAHSEVQPKPSPRWQSLKPTGKVNDANVPIPGRPIIVNCHGHTEIGLCDDCTGELALVLADIPQLLDDLDIAIAGETRFVEHGASETRNPDRTGGGHPAIAAQNRITATLHELTDWFDNHGPAHLARALAAHLEQVQHEPRMPNLARNLSSAASRAHKVIDAPADLMFYGPCPSCGRDLVQERIHHEDTETPVACRYPSCEYAQPLDTHQKNLLEAGQDRWLTVGELVSAITSGGEVVTRAQINGWIERGGLAREKRVRPRYLNGELTTTEVWTYRLGDVRDRAARGDQRRKTNA